MVTKIDGTLGVITPAVVFPGSPSGSITLTAPVGSGSYNIQLPANNGQVILADPEGTIVLTNSGGGSVTLKPAVGTSNTTFTFPNSNGTAGYFLTTNGSGVTSWVSGAPTGVTTFSGGTTGLTPTSPTGGAVTLGGTLAVANGGTGVTTSTGSGSVVLSTSPTLVTPALGIPSSGTLTNCTGLPLTTGVTGTLSISNGGTGVTSSTGFGSLVLSTSPSLVTPDLGTPSNGTLTNCTGLPLTTGVTGILPVANGGTGVTTVSALQTLVFPSQAGNTGKYLTTNGSVTSWSSLTGIPLFYSLVSDLRSATPVAGTVAIAEGFYSVGDGGGGAFYGVTGAAPGTYVDNTGTIIVPTGGNGSSAWLRTYDGPVNVSWFGAKGDGVTNDYLFMYRAAVFAAAQGKALELVPGKNYISSSLFGVICSIIGNNSTISGLIQLSASNTFIQDLNVISPTAGPAIYLRGESTGVLSNIKLENVKISFSGGTPAFRLGLYVTYVDNLVINNCSIDYGANLIRCANYRFTNNILNGYNQNEAELLHSTVRSYGLIEGNTFLNSLDNWMDLYSSGEKTVVNGNRFDGNRGRLGTGIEIKVTLTNNQNNTSGGVNDYGYDQYIIFTNNYVGNYAQTTVAACAILNIYYLDSRVANFTGVISAGTPDKLTVSGLDGTIVIGGTVNATGIGAGVTILSQDPGGTPGGNGVYTLSSSIVGGLTSRPMTLDYPFTAFIDVATPNKLQVTAVTGGLYIAAGGVVNAAGIGPGVTILSQDSSTEPGGALGGTGIYTLSSSIVAGVASTTMTLTFPFTWAKTPNSMVISGNIFDGLDTTANGSQQAHVITVATCESINISNNVFKRICVGGTPPDVSSCVNIVNSKNIVVANNIMNIRGGTGVVLHQTCDNIKIIGNQVINDTGNGYNPAYGVQAVKYGSENSVVLSNIAISDNKLEATIASARLLNTSGSVTGMMFSNNVCTNETVFEAANDCQFTNNVFAVQTGRFRAFQIGYSGAVSQYNLVLGNKVYSPPATPLPGLQIVRCRASTISQNIIKTASFGMLVQGTLTTGELDYLVIKDNISISQVADSFPVYSSMSADDAATLQIFSSVPIPFTATPNASFTGVIASGTPTKLTTSSVNGTIIIGATLTGVGVPAGVTIVSQDPGGTTGGAGVYTLSASITGGLTSRQMNTLGAVTFGIINSNQKVT